MVQFSTEATETKGGISAATRSHFVVNFVVRKKGIHHRDTTQSRREFVGRENRKIQGGVPTVEDDPCSRCDSRFTVAGYAATTFPQSETRGNVSEPERVDKTG
jgi:hypothetical protein